MAYVEIVRVQKPVSVSMDDVLTISEAAQLLGVTLTEVKSMTLRTAEPLRLLVDLSEPNPSRANRVLRDEVLAEKRRRTRR